MSVSLDPLEVLMRACVRACIGVNSECCIRDRKPHLPGLGERVLKYEASLVIVVRHSMCARNTHAGFINRVEAYHTPTFGRKGPCLISPGINQMFLKQVLGEMLARHPKRLSSHTIAYRGRRCGPASP